MILSRSLTSAAEVGCQPSFQRSQPGRVSASHVEYDPTTGNVEKTRADGTTEYIEYDRASGKLKHAAGRRANEHTKRKN